MTAPRLACRVQTQFLADRSDPARSRYAFAYTVTIENQGDAAAQLVGRHWRIEEDGRPRQEVRGLGVVGQQPLIGPGESHTYTSWVELDAPSGAMEGQFLCLSLEAEPFTVDVPRFELAFASVLH